MLYQDSGIFVTNLVTSLLSSRSSNSSVESVEGHATVVAKGLCIVVLFITAGICGYLPFVLDRWFNWKNSKADSTAGIWIRSLLYFGGGCLICVTFQHIVVEVSEDIAELQASGRLAATSFDLALFLMCVGFMVMFLVEELIHLYMHHHDHKQKHQDELTGNGVHDSSDKESQSDNISQHHHRSLVHSHLPPVGDENESVLVSSLRGLLVVLALSIHALFEGLAIGLQETVESAWYVTGAISGHKLVLAFCIGIELIVAKTRLWLAFIYVFIFIIVAPIGIGVGIGVTVEQTSATDIPSAIIQGLASGTLLYAAFFEILFKERSGLWTYFSFVLGFFVMYAIIVGTHSAEKPVYCESTVVFVNATTPGPVKLLSEL